MLSQLHGTLLAYLDLQKRTIRHSQHFRLFAYLEWYDFFVEYLTKLAFQSGFGKHAMQPQSFCKFLTFDTQKLAQNKNAHWVTHTIQDLTWSVTCEEETPHVNWHFRDWINMFTRLTLSWHFRRKCRCRLLCNKCMQLIRQLNILVPRYRWSRFNTKCHEVTLMVELLIISGI